MSASLRRGCGYCACLAWKWGTPADACPSSSTSNHTLTLPLPLRHYNAAACSLLNWTHTAALGRLSCDTTTGMSYSFPEIRVCPYKSSRQPATKIRMLVSFPIFILPAHTRPLCSLTNQDTDGRKSPTLTCYINSLPPATPFRVSIHSWATTARPSAIIESRRKPSQKTMYMVQVIVDGAKIL